MEAEGREIHLCFGFFFFLRFLFARPRISRLSNPFILCRRGNLQIDWFLKRKQFSCCFFFGEFGAENVIVVCATMRTFH